MDGICYAFVVFDAYVGLSTVMPKRSSKSTSRPTRRPQAVSVSNYFQDCTYTYM